MHNFVFLISLPLLIFVFIIAVFFWGFLFFESLKNFCEQNENRKNKKSKNSR